MVDCEYILLETENQLFENRIEKGNQFYIYRLGIKLQGASKSVYGYIQEIIHKK